MPLQSLSLLFSTRLRCRFCQSRFTHKIGSASQRWMWLIADWGRTRTVLFLRNSRKSLFSRAVRLSSSSHTVPAFFVQIKESNLFNQSKIRTRVIHAFPLVWYSNQSSFPDSFLKSRGFMFFPMNINWKRSVPDRLRHDRHVIRDLFNVPLLTGPAESVQWWGWRLNN